MVTDPIADYLTRVRNAIKANHRLVEIPSSKLLVEITRILHESGYILNYKVVDDVFPKQIKIALKYHPVSKLSAITSLTRASKPGLRLYSGANDIPRVMNGLGIAIVSTSSGLMTDKKARTENVGGEVLCYIA